MQSYREEKMRRGFWAGLSVIIGLAILFSMPVDGKGADVGNPTLQMTATTPIYNGQRVTLAGAGYAPGEVLDEFGAVVRVHNEDTPYYYGVELPTEVTANAFGEFRVEMQLDMLSGIKGFVELVVIYDGNPVFTDFFPVEDSGVYTPYVVDATGGTLKFDTFSKGGSGEPPVENGDDLPLTSNGNGDWQGDLYQVNELRYTTVDATGSPSYANNITNDVTFVAGSPYNDLASTASAVVEQLSTTYKSLRLEVLVWDGSIPSIAWTTMSGTTQGEDWLSTADVTAPEVLSAVATDTVEIVVTFSETVTIPSDSLNALDNWAVTYNGSRQVYDVQPRGSSASTCTLTVADMGDRDATPVIQFTSGTDEYEDASGNDCASTTAPHITATDGIAPQNPTMDSPTSSTFLLGSIVTWSATEGSGTSSMTFQGSTDGSSWEDLNTDNSTPFSGSYDFSLGTEYTYYRVQASDASSNTANSDATANLQDAFFIDLTTIPSSVAVNVESDQWEFTIKDNYGNSELVTQTFGLSTASSTGEFRATSGGSQVGSIDLSNSSTGNFYYLDETVGTWEIKVSNINYLPDSSDFQITAGAATSIQIKLPGQAFASGTGVYGSPDFGSFGGDVRWSLAGTAFPIVLYLVDAYDNRVYDSGTYYIDFSTTAYNAPNGTAPTLNSNQFPYTNVAVDFTDGQSTTSLSVLLYDFTQNYADVTLTAAENGGGLTGDVSSGFWVMSETADHIDWVTSDGSTPTSSPVNATQTAGTALPTLYIAAMDAYNNVDTTYSGSSITTVGGSSNPPTNSPSGTGQGGANAPNGNTAPDYGTSSTWNDGVVTLTRTTTNQWTIVYDADATGFRIRAGASGGSLDGLYTSNSDQFAVSAASGNYLRIEDTSGGGTEYVDGETFTTAQTIVFWAIYYDTYGNLIGNYSTGTWSSTNLTPSASGTGAYWSFSPTAAASSGTLTITNGGIMDRTISNITVSADETISYIMLRTAPNGGGAEVTTFEVAGQDNGSNENYSDYMYVAAYNNDDLFIRDTSATWTEVDMTGGSFETGGSSSSNRYIASSTSNQTGYVSVDVSGATDSSGVVTIDATAPATPQGFNIAEYSENNRYVTATWSGTSSYDDGSSAASGPVADLEIRFSTTQINDETAWDNATSVGDLNEPNFSLGYWQVYMGDNAAGYYYYAIKTRDDQGYWSDMGTGCYTTSPDYSLPVSLSLFNARGGYGKIEVNWSTESEVDALGFRLYRDVSENFDQKTLIADYESNVNLLCQGNSATGFDYSVVDDIEIEAETMYYYQLEAVDVNGRSEISTLQASAEALPLPTDYSIGPNYPNPFNPDTRFELKLPETGKVSIIVYDALGREVSRVLDNETLDAGIHQLSWNGQNSYGASVPSGIYFGLLKAEGTQRIMKMLLLK